MTHDEYIEKAYETIKIIKKSCNNGVVKSHMISNLADIKTGKYVGIQVILELSTKYDYTDDVLNGWKKDLCSDSFYISVLRNQLHIHFNIHYQSSI